MSKARKIFVWGASGTGILLVLIAAAAVVLPHILNTGIIGRDLETKLEARYHIRADRIRISFLPFPFVVMHKVRATIPGKLNASADAVFLHLKILPLFMGKFTPSKAELLHPTVAARLPEQASESSAKSPSQTLPDLKKRISRLEATLRAIIPGAAIDVRNGSLEIYRGRNRVFYFKNIYFKSSVHANGVDFELTSGKSNLWHALALSGRVAPGTLKGSAELNVAGGNPGDLMRYLDASASRRIGDSRIDLALTLSSSGSGNAHADFMASVPLFTLDGGHQTIIMKNGVLAGSFHSDANGIELFISDLEFDHPRLNLAASCIERYSDRTIALTVDGSDTDAATVRRVLLAVNHKHRTTRRIFEIIRKAQVPRIVFSARSNRFSGLKKLENFTIKCKIEKGVVFAPKADLLVSNVSADILVKDCILTAIRLSGQSAGSSTRDGKLRIGLRRDNHLFHLDLPIRADLSELPEVLKRVVADHAFRQELAQVKDVTGKAQGRLIIGGKLHALTVRVETGPFQLFGRYGRLPEPLALQGASFRMKGSKISVTSLTGKSGSSSFNLADLSYDWGKGKLLKIDSKGRSVISMELLGPLLRSHEYWKNFLDETPKGLLDVDSFRFLGPPADRSKWLLDASGSVKDVVLQDKRLNDPLILKTGAFKIEGDKIAFMGINAVLADSVLSISGSVTDYLDHPNRVDLQLSGRLGPKGNKIAASIAGLPDSLKAISHLDLISSNITWDKGLKTAFKGEMQLSAGPRITINVVKTPLELSIEDLTIKDKDSDAAISMNSGQNHLEIGFSGTLSDKTVDRLLIDNNMLKGSIKGKFKADIYPDTPGKSSARGEVTISGFQLPADFPVSALIEKAVLDADGNKLNVESAAASWNGSKVSLRGSIALSGGVYRVNIKALAGSLDLESILKSRWIAQKAEDNLGRPSPQSPKKPWDKPVEGIIRVKSRHLTYGKISWDPADGDVILRPGSIDVRLTRARVCGISTPGNITITPEGTNISVRLSAKNKDLGSTLACLLNKRHILSGSYTLIGNLKASNINNNLADSLEGDVELRAKDGRIFPFNTFTKIISLLSISEIYRGVVPDLLDKGCPYKSLEAKGRIKDGKLVLSDSVLDGPCIKMVFRGEIDLARRKVNVIALVAPQRTVERVVNATPLMGKVLKDAFVTMPVRISGNLADPSVVLLSPDAVGQELFGVMKRILKLPLTIFQPLVKKGVNSAAASKTGEPGSMKR